LHKKTLLAIAKLFIQKGAIRDAYVYFDIKPVCPVLLRIRRKGTERILPLAGEVETADGRRLLQELLTRVSEAFHWHIQAPLSVVV